ncbi:WbqC family protein [Flavobacterium qiangtangense]|uniref:WbqC family protein n=1 Tax=Flavobacterium qiangtangense TaxID=1442595 RepID=A0ABW1PSI5_9FLAO
MKVAIMQPYLFPYIGYFQLINAVDVFVVYDDVNYINKGYVNRNSILVNGRKFKFTFSIIGASQNSKISELKFDLFSTKFLKTIKMAYSHAPNFNCVLPIIEEVFQFENKNVSKFLTNSLLKICEYLQIQTRILVSSELQLVSDKKASDRIISICKWIGGTTYINAIGGKMLYDATEFERNNLILKFLKSDDIEYKQFANLFVPWLSIIDVMMFNDVLAIKKMLNNYTLN